MEKRVPKYGAQPITILANGTCGARNFNCARI